VSASSLLRHSLSTSPGTAACRPSLALAARTQCAHPYLGARQRSRTCALFASPAASATRTRPRPRASQLGGSATAARCSIARSRLRVRNLTRSLVMVGPASGQQYGTPTLAELRAKVKIANANVALTAAQARLATPASAAATLSRAQAAEQECARQAAQHQGPYPAPSDVEAAELAAQQARAAATAAERAHDLAADRLAALSIGLKESGRAAGAPLDQRATPDVLAAKRGK
jgi:hypothetical protein